MAEVWRIVRQDDGTAYYFNEETNISQWDPPVGDNVQLLEFDDEESEEEEEYEEEEADETPVNSDATAQPALETEDYGIVAPISNSPVKRSHVRRSVIGSVTEWEIRHTESSGMDTGDAYYYNTQTGETRWDRPEELIELDKVAEEDVEFDEDAPLTESFDLLDFFGEDAERYRLQMIEGGSDATPCFKRLRHLRQLVQSVGSEEEWRDLVLQSDFQLPRTILAYLAEGSPLEVRSLVAQLLVLVGQVAPEIFEKIATGAWFSLRVLVGMIRQALDEEKEDDQLLAWLLLLSHVLKEAPVPTAEDELPDEPMVVRLFDIMADASERVFLTCAQSALSLNQQYLDHHTNVVMSVCKSHPKAEYFGEALLHILNKLGYPYEDEKLLRQCLKASKDFFSDPSTSNYFYTNDLKVLLDIIIREAGDLPPTDTVRSEYLNVLHPLLLNSQWVHVGRYRKDDVAKVLEDIFDSGGRLSDMHPDAKAATEVILRDCMHLLE